MLREAIESDEVKPRIEFKFSRSEEVDELFRPVLLKQRVSLETTSKVRVIHEGQWQIGIIRFNPKIFDRWLTKEFPKRWKKRELVEYLGEGKIVLARNILRRFREIVHEDSDYKENLKLMKTDPGKTKPIRFNYSDLSSLLRDELHLIESDDSIQGDEFSDATPVSEQVIVDFLKLEVDLTGEFVKGSGRRGGRRFDIIQKARQKLIDEGFLNYGDVCLPC